MKTQSSYSIKALIAIVLILAVWHLLEASLAPSSAEIVQEEQELQEAEEAQEPQAKENSEDSNLEGLNSFDLESELEGLGEIERL